MPQEADGGDSEILEEKTTPSTTAATSHNSLKQQVEAVNASSVSAKSSWAFFLGLMAYLAVVTAGVTHKDLLLDNQIKLPALGELSLSRFFALAPAAFLIIYLGLLLQLASLADKVRALNLEIKRLPADQVDNRCHQHPLRDSLSTFMVVQALGGRIVSPGRNALLRSLSWLSLAWLPMLLLLFFQISFLPYHSEAHTIAHQSCVVIGALMASRFVPAIMNVSGHGRAFTALIFVPAFFAIIAFSLFVATTPDSQLDRAARSVWSTEVRMGYSQFTRPVFPPTALLFEGDSNTISGKPSSGFSRNLVVIDAFKKAEGKQRSPINLRGRDLRYGIFDRSDFTGADFTASRLDGARFDSAVLREAAFGCAIVKTSRLSQFADQAFRHFMNSAVPVRLVLIEDEACSVLSRSSFASTDLEGATLKGGRIDHVEFAAAQMPSANFSEMDVTGVSFILANLSGAKFSKAKILGSSFAYAKMENTTFNNSEIVFSNLSDAELSLSSFADARIILCNLESASLIGADLSTAFLYGTTLANSFLWGATAPEIASFAFGNLSGTKLDPREVTEQSKVEWLKQKATQDMALS